MHNLVAENEWATAFGAGGALEALVEARTQGLVRFIGVTGHGSQVAAMHRRSLERFAFDSVLFPYNFTMLEIKSYEEDVEALLKVCREREVATQLLSRSLAADGRMATVGSSAGTSRCATARRFAVACISC